MKKNFGKLCMGGVLLFSLSMSLTSCDPYLDDILGEWSRPTPGGNVTPGGGSSSDETTPTMKATPLTLEAITAGTIVVKNPQTGMQFSLNGGAKQAVTTDAIPVAVGDKVQFYGSGTSITAYYILDDPYNDPANDTNISGGTAKVKVYGNIMSLVDETGFETATALTGDFAFGRLFNGNTMLTDISDLQLPATNLTRACYQNLFQGCTSLTTIPEALLPATTLANQCYQSMFWDCKGLTTLPEKLLPATEMKPSCYATMFYQRTGLTTVPEKLLPAETLAEWCYQSLFQGCYDLTTAPALPATNLANNCYFQMFYNCTSLTASPVLPATSLVTGCYQNMFENCSNLTVVTCLATTALNAENCTNSWLSGVAATGTFYKAAGATADGGATTSTNYSRDVNGIPADPWTFQNYVAP